MKLFIIFGILAVAYFVYRSLTVDATPTATQVETSAVQEVTMPNTESKNSIIVAAGAVVLIVSVIAAAFLL